MWQGGMLRGGRYLLRCEGRLRCEMQDYLLDKIYGVKIAM